MFPAEQLLVSRYEDLVRDPKGVLERVLTHVGLPLDRMGEAALWHPPLCEIALGYSRLLHAADRATLAPSARTLCREVSVGAGGFAGAPGARIAGLWRRRLRRRRHTEGRDQRGEAPRGGHRRAAAGVLRAPQRGAGQRRSASVPFCCAPRSLMGVLCLRVRVGVTSRRAW